MARFTNSRNSYVLQGILNPIDSEDAANKRYVDNLITGSQGVTYEFRYEIDSEELVVVPSIGDTERVYIPDTRYSFRYDSENNQLQIFPRGSASYAINLPDPGAGFSRFTTDTDGLVPAPGDSNAHSYNYLAGDGTWQHITGYNVKRVAFHTHWERNLSTIEWNTGDLAIVTVTGGYYGGYGFSQGLTTNNQIYVEFANATEAAATRTNYLLPGRRIANLDGGRAYTINAVSSLDTTPTYPRYTVTLDTDRQGNDFQNYNAVAYYDSDGFDPGIFIFTGTNGDSDGTVDADWTRIEGEQDHFRITLNPRSVTVTDPNGVQATIPAFGASHAGVVPEPGTINNTANHYLAGDGNWRRLPTDSDTMYQVFDTDTNGLVPGTDTDNNNGNYYLAGDGTWRHLPADSDTTYQVFDTDNDGLVPHNDTDTNTNQYFLGGDGRWHHVPSIALDSEHLTTFSQDSDGLVPGPESAEATSEHYLAGDGQWRTRDGVRIRRYIAGTNYDSEAIVELSDAGTTHLYRANKPVANAPALLVDSDWDIIHAAFDLARDGTSVPGQHTVLNFADVQSLHNGGIHPVVTVTPWHRGPYRSGANYPVNSVVVHNGREFIAIDSDTDSPVVASTTDLPSATWSLIGGLRVDHGMSPLATNVHTLSFNGGFTTVDHSNGEIDIETTDRGIYLPNQRYRIGQHVQHNGQFWACDSEIAVSPAIAANINLPSADWTNLSAGADQPFNLYNDVSTHTSTLDALDRFLVSVDSDNTFTYWGDMTQTIFNQADGVYERKIAHVTSPVDPAPSGAFNVPARVQSTGQIRTSANISSTTPSWGFFDNVDFSVFPTSSETYTTGVPTAWSGYFTGTRRYMAVNFGSTLSFSNLGVLFNGHVGTAPIYLVAFRDDDNWAIWQLNTGVAEETRLNYIGRQAPTLVESQGTPGSATDTTRWTFGFNSSSQIVNVIEQPAVDTRVLANGANGPEYSLVNVGMLDTTLRGYLLDTDRSDALSDRIHRLQVELDAGVGAFPIEAGHNSYVARREFTDFDVNSDSRSITINTYAKDSDAATALTQFIDSELVNDSTRLASIRFGINTYISSTVGFRQYYLDMFLQDSDEANAIYNESANTITIHSRLAGVNGLVRLLDANGNTITSPADEDFGSGYFTHIDAYRASDGSFADLESQFESLGDVKYSYNDIFNNRIPMVVDDTDAHTPETRMIALGSSLNYSNDDNELSVVGNTVRDYTAGAEYLEGSIVQVEENDQIFLWRAHGNIASAPSTFTRSQWQFLGGEIIQNNGAQLDGEFQTTNYQDFSGVTANSNADTVTVTPYGRGPYAAGREYTPGEQVTHNGKLWLCHTTDSETVVPSDTDNLSADHWNLVGRDSTLNPTELIKGVVGASQFLGAGTAGTTQYVRYGLIDPNSISNAINHYVIFYLEDANSNPTFFEVYPDDGQAGTVYTTVPTTGRLARRTFTGTGDDITWIDGV